jgi:hypothetical protein
MGVTRRDFLKAGAAGAALLVAGPQRVLGQTQSFPAGRASRLFPGNGRFVIHSDLHNHTIFSDGGEAAADAFDQMRAVQLDATAITDHAVLGKIIGSVCTSQPCSNYGGINEDHWQSLRTIADQKHEDGAFVAMRGFEWTTGTIGHVNVWFTEQWTDTLVMAAQSPKGLEALFEVLPPPGPDVNAVLLPVLDQLPETATMDLFYDWLQAAPDRPLLGGGNDGLAGFNHPNEYGNFESFKFVPGLLDRIVSCEALNMDRDFLFWGSDEGMPSPLNACLNAGWRVGMLGVSDEHFDKWGETRGRGGLWVTSLTRDGVREALATRRMYATFEKGLRLDAAANGVQMGRTVPHASGPVRFDLDIDMGPTGYGRPLKLQVLRPGSEGPTLAHEQDIRLLPPSAPVISVTLPVDVSDGTWALLRVTDPAQPADDGTPAPFAAAGRAIAYASPFWFEPAGAAGAAPAPAPAGPAQARGGTLAATGGSTGPAAAAVLAALGALAARRAARHVGHDHEH